MFTRVSQPNNEYGGLVHGPYFYLAWNSLLGRAHLIEEKGRPNNETPMYIRVPITGPDVYWGVTLLNGWLTGPPLNILPSM